MKTEKLAENIFVIDNFWGAEQCSLFIEQSEAAGFSPATINTDFGQRRIESVRNNMRLMYKDKKLANEIWERLKMMIPAEHGNSKAIDVNEMFRIYKYEDGQEFKKHRDQSFIRNDSEASYFTFMIYLNDDFEGGETVFNHISVKPLTGRALVFLHPLEHAGASVSKGIKYVLRTDVMYKLASY